MVAPAPQLPPAASAAALAAAVAVAARAAAAAVVREVVLCVEVERGKALRVDLKRRFFVVDVALDEVVPKERGVVE